jgi:hypothetical protein
MRFAGIMGQSDREKKGFSPTCYDIGGVSEGSDGNETSPMSVPKKNE